MDKETIFVRTSKGEDEARHVTAHLNGDVKRALLMVDGVSKYNEISKRAAPSLRQVLGEMLDELEKSGFIQNAAKAVHPSKVAQPGSIPKIVVPLKTPTPLKKPMDDGFGELDFTSVFRAPSPEDLAAEAEKENAKARVLSGEKLKQETEAERIKMEAARVKAEQDAARARAELEAARKKAKAEASARADAEAKIKQEIEAARLKAQQEAEAASFKAKQEAAKMREEAEAARIKAEQEAARVRAELEAAKAKADAEAKARAETEAKIKQEIEAARLKAQQEAEAARFKAEQEAAKAREEIELARQQAAAEARAREEAERRAREEAEAARVKAEQEAAQMRAELEAEKAKSEADRLKAEQEAAKAREQAELVRQQAEAEARQEIEAARLKAQQEAAKAREEAELARQQAATEARAREEAEHRAREEADAARIKAEQDTAQARAELEVARAKAEAARLQAEQEAAKAREEAELIRQQLEAKAGRDVVAARLQAQQEIEAARLNAEQEAAKMREQAELDLQKAEAEVRAREEAERNLKEEAENARIKAEQEAVQAEMDETETEAEEASNLKALEEADALLLQSARDAAHFDKLEKISNMPKPGSSRSSSATVLFFDVVGYTRQPVRKQGEIKKQFNQLLTDCLMGLGDGERIILDTGDGAAIGFLQHPEDALEVAMQFRSRMMANQHQDYPDLKVRIGIHLGPINIVRDMNGQNNMVGDGINDAQRVMSFADADQIFISRPYYDYVSRLSDEYDELFKYRGTEKDKHGREHTLYELVDATTPVGETASSQISDFSSAMTLDAFNFSIPAGAASAEPEKKTEELETQQAPAGQAGGLEQYNLPEELPESVDEEQTSAVEEQPGINQPEAAPPPESVPEAAPVEEGEPAKTAHLPSAEEVAKLAETEAKIWAEAEQRARKSAGEKSDQKAQPSVAREIPALQAPRKPVPWGMAGAGIFVLLLIGLFVIPFVLPTKDYATGIEKMLSAKLKQPVHIGGLSGRLLPSPRLELSHVSIGEGNAIQAQRAQINFGLSALFASIKAIDSIELDGMQANGAALQQMSTWLQQIAADTHYPVSRIKLNQGKLEADGIQLSGISGELGFNPAGQFTRAKLQAEGNKFALEMNATPEKKIQVAITVHGSGLPLLPNWVFDDLDAKGELTRDELVITELDGQILGGKLLGNMRINWASGWQAQGNLTAKSITMQNVSKALNGDMDGTAQFRMQSASLAKLVENANLSGSFSVEKGVINGIDIVEAARLRSRENAPGGRTHFDELSGDLSVANGVYAFHQLKINAGVLSVTGTLDVAKQQLSGRISADLKMRAGMGPVALRVGGTTDSPLLQTTR